MMASYLLRSAGGMMSAPTNRRIASRPGGSRVPSPVATVGHHR